MSEMQLVVNIDEVGFWPETHCCRTKC